MWRNTSRRGTALHCSPKYSLTLVFQIMALVGSWGQHFEIIAAAAYFDVCVVVFQPNQGAEQVFGKEEHPRIFLQNNGGQHYVWMRPEYRQQY